MLTPLSVRNTNLPRHAFQNRPTLSGWQWLLPAIPLAIWLVLELFTTPDELFLQLNQRARMLPDRIWIFFDLFGNGWYDFALATPLLLLAPRNLIASLYAGAIAGLLGRILKLTFELPRPASVIDPANFHIIGNPLTSLAMPSGHTLTAFALVTAFYFSTSPAKRKLLLPLFLFATSAGLARVAVGAHWPADIMAGAALGICGGLIGCILSAKLPAHLLSAQSWLLRGLALGSVLCVYVLLTSEIDFIAARPFQWFAASVATIGVIAFATQTIRRPRHY